jgi:hypothetical protein
MPFFVGGLIGGILAVLCVFVGNALEVPGFHISSGFWGTNFLVGPGLFDTTVILMVSVIWFVYGAVAIGTLSMIVFAERTRGRNREGNHEGPV